MLHEEMLISCSDFSIIEPSLSRSSSTIEQTVRRMALFGVIVAEVKTMRRRELCHKLG